MLDVKNSKNETVKQIACPSCKIPLQVKFQPQREQQEPIEAKTFYATPKRVAAGSDETQLAKDCLGATQLFSASQESSANAMLSCGGKDYYLEEGQNIVGRHGTTSQATVQIETADRYMSRQHCRINITKLPDGTIKAVLSNYRNKNLTTIDGQPVEIGDSIRLTDGNCITMGNTTVTFKLS